MYCYKCGKEIPLDSCFCPYCGSETVQGMPNKSNNTPPNNNEKNNIFENQPSKNAVPPKSKKAFRNVLIGVFIGILAIVLIVCAVIYTNSYLSKANCEHDNEYEIEILSSKDATCQSTGLTEGKKCKFCGDILVSQQEIPAISCKEGNWITDVSPAKGKNGLYHTECTMCGKTMRSKTVYVDSQGLQYEKLDNGTLGVVSDSLCTSTTIEIPSMYNGIKVTEICNKAIQSDKVTKVTIKSGVKTISTDAFYYCKSLTEIVVPKSITVVGGDAIYYCNKLKTIQFDGTIDEWKSLSWSGWAWLTSCTVYCKDGNKNY